MIRMKAVFNFNDIDLLKLNLPLKLQKDPLFKF